MTARTEFRVGHVVDRRFALRREIARGGVCVLFEAEHVHTGRVVAIKVLEESLAECGESRARLLREARAASVVAHPHVVSVLDAGTTTSGEPFVALEMLNGRSLDAILAARGRLSLAQTLVVARALVAALAHSHRMGVVHRDVKPSNVFICRSEGGEECVKVIDFGICAFGDAGADERPRPRITRSETILGTAEYMPLERILDACNQDPRGDVYSVAVTLFECLTGTVPFEGTFGSVVYKAATSRRAPLAAVRADVPNGVARAIERAMSRSADERHVGMAEFGAALFEGIPPTTGTRLLAGSDANREPEVSEDVARRRHPRAEYVTPVTLLLGSGQSVDGRSADLSEGGMLVLPNQELPLGQEVRIRFATPVSGRIVETAAVARWRKERARRSAIGLEFVTLAEAARSEVRRYVELMGTA
ncbi:MAG: serine/threonine-protein kinase [Polyangiaceae bacterium]